MSAIHLDARIDAKSLEALAKALRDLVQTPGDQKTIRFAMKTLVTAVSPEVKNVSINNCSFLSRDEGDSYPEDHEAELDGD